MKKTITGILLAAMLFSLAACGGSEASAPPTIPTNAPSESTPPEQPTEKSVTVDEGLLNVDITFPATWFEGEDMSTFDADAYAQEQGFKKAVVNADGTVTVTMSKAKHKEMLEEMHKEVTDGFVTYIEDTEYIKDIKHDNDFRKITVLVDAAGYKNAFDMTPFLVGMTSGFYQMLLGEEIAVDIDIVDAATNDVLSSSKFPPE